MKKSLVKYFSKDHICLKSISLTGLHPTDLIENAPSNATWLGIYDEVPRFAKLDMNELEKICQKGEKLCKS